MSRSRFVCPCVSHSRGGELKKITRKRAKRRKKRSQMVSGECSFWTLHTRGTNWLPQSQMANFHWVPQRPLVYQLHALQHTSPFKEISLRNPRLSASTRNPTITWQTCFQQHLWTAIIQWGWSCRRSSLFITWREQEWSRRSLWLENVRRSWTGHLETKMKPLEGTRRIKLFYSQTVLVLLNILVQFF